MTTIANILLQSSAGRPFSADVYYQENGVPKPVVVFIHGFKGFKDWGCWGLFAEAFAHSGFVFVKFNCSHNGVTIEKPSEFADMEAFGHNTYSKELADLRHVMDWLANVQTPIPAHEMDSNRLGLIGHSRGGGIALVYASQDERVKSVATWAGVSNLAFMWEGNPALEDWKKQGVINIHNARTGQNMPVYLDVYEDYNEHQPQLNIEYAMRNRPIPCLIVHGDADTSVPVEAAHQLQSWNPSAQLILVNGADHVFGMQHPCISEALPPHAQAVARESIDFFQAHL